ncbi:MAG: PepSY-associated TM helix domain-containing protein [Planctomycetota bacterium]
MKLYKFLWDTHKWTGVIASVVLALLSITGFLLLVKKDYEWLQPPTQRGSDGGIETFISMKEAIDAAIAYDANDVLASYDDVDRIDVRPWKRVYKIRANEAYGEIQVDAISGTVLSADWRASDWIESLHDGSYFGDWAHRYVMPVVAIALLFLTGSGLYLWLAKIFTRRRSRRRKRSRRLPSPERGSG